MLGEPVIEIRNLSKSFQPQGSRNGDGDDDTEQELVTALNDVNLYAEPIDEHYAIRRGEFVILRGPSGGGIFLRHQTPHHRTSG